MHKPLETKKLFVLVLVSAIVSIFYLILCVFFVLAEKQNYQKEKQIFQLTVNFGIYFFSHQDIFKLVKKRKQNKIFRAPNISFQYMDK